MITVDCLADCHGHYPKLEGGDLLIVAGDLTARDLENENALFDYWINEQLYKKKIVIAGNHDNVLFEGRLKLQFCEYLCDSGTEFEGLKIWGSPWTLRFPGMNPHCMAFTVDTEEELAEKWALIPDDVDILVTHGPPMSILDWNSYGHNCGSASLTYRATCLPNLKLFAFGHIHEAYGQYTKEDLIEFSQQNIKIFGPPKCKSMPHIVNASHVNEHYEPVNKPIRIKI